MAMSGGPGTRVFVGVCMGVDVHTGCVSVAVGVGDGVHVAVRVVVAVRDSVGVGVCEAVTVALGV